MSRTLSHCEKRYPAVEKEATAVIEAVHFLKGRYFTIVTDQEAISFMFDQRHHGKINNTKILCWRLELGQYNLALSMLHPIRFRGCVVLRLESLSSNYTNLLVTRLCSFLSLHSSV